MTATEGTLLTLLPVLLVASAFFSGSETALFGLMAHERAGLAQQSPRGARAVEALLRQPRMLLITILLGNMVANMLFFVMASVLVLGASTGTERAIYSVATLLAVILLGEIAPKLIAASRRARWCALFAAPLLILHRLIAPVRLAVNALVVEPASRLVGASASEPLSVEELGELLEISAREGAIDPVEAELLDDVVELGALRVRDVMTPRVRVRWIDADAGREELVRAARQWGVLRLPVAQGSLDHGVLGVVDVPGALGRLSVGPDLSARDLMDPPIFVPDQARLDQLLEQLRGRRRLVAIAVDEFGSVAGLVTFHDIAERMGRSLATDDADANAGAEADDLRIERLGPARWRVHGRLCVRDLAEAVGPTGRASAGSVAGVIQLHLGRLARPGDRVRVGGLMFEVESVRGRAIETVLVSLGDDEGDPS